MIITMPIFKTYTTVTASFDEDLKPLIDALSAYKPNEVIKLLIDFYEKIEDNIEGARRPKTIYFDGDPFRYINKEGYDRDIELDKIYAFLKVPREMGLRFAQKCQGQYKYKNVIYEINYRSEEHFTLSNYGYITRLCNLDNIETIKDLKRSNNNSG